MWEEATGDNNPEGALYADVQWIINEECKMYLDHPKISATNGNTEPDRIERINRVYGYALALADVARNGEFLGKLSHLHDHKGRLIVVWFEAPTEEEKNFFVQAWNSKVGDESTHVEHEIKPPGAAAFMVSPDAK
jgi:hypothetical protein